MSITVILVLVWLHFVAVFILQTDEMALNKSSSWEWLAIHVCVYSLPFLFGFGIVFAGINFAAHFVTDAVSSRVTKKLWQQEKRHWFFVVIGIDQALHMTALFLSYWYLNQ